MLSLIFLISSYCKKNQVLKVFIFTSFAALVLSCTPITAQIIHIQPSNEMLMNIREEFYYEVMYGPFRLGFVDIIGFKDTTYYGKEALYYAVIMWSNPNFFLIGHKEEHFFTILTRNDESLYGLRFWSDDIDSDVPDEYNYESDSLYKTLFVRVVDHEMDEIRHDTVEIDAPWLLGSDIFQFSRHFAGLDTTLMRPLYVSETLDTVALNFKSSISPRYYSAFPDSINTFYLDGQAPFKGPFGFSGSFRAWFATDSTRIPLEAHVDVWIGHVKVRLIKYTRTK